MAGVDAQHGGVDTELAALQAELDAIRAITASDGAADLNANLNDASGGRSEDGNDDSLEEGNGAAWDAAGLSSSDSGMSSSGNDERGCNAGGSVPAGPGETSDALPVGVCMA